ncbi:acyltransferase, partial [Clostridium perfringens]
MGACEQVRKVTRYPVDGPNALWQLYRTVSPWKGVKNFIFIQLSRSCPVLSWKNGIYRRMLGMKVGEHTAFGLMVMVDVCFPELITIGRNSVIGYNTTILAHEYLIKEYRLCEVRIGDE